MCYLQQLEQLPPEHFWQELQLVAQPLQSLHALALSAADALARPKPATMASRAPALIRVWSVFIVVDVFRRGGCISFQQVICRCPQNPPGFFQKLLSALFRLLFFG
jgi:hypothetical protein